MNNFFQIADRVLAPTYRRPEILFVHGHGARLTDAAGRSYLDMTSGIAVNALGYGSATIARAIQESATGLIHTSNLFHTAPAVALATELTERSFAARVFFANSGAEANEAAIKFARLRGGEHRRRIVYFAGAFHGRTFGSLAATDRPSAREPFTPLPRGFARAEWNEPGALEQIDEKTAAVMIEPVQGEGGIRVPDGDWIANLRRRCDDTGALLIVDEVQTGLGRTGRLWGHEHFSVRPDLMTLAKPLAGGLPMGAVLMTEEVAAHVTPGSHATTFGGGPLVASVALAVLLEVADPAFLNDVVAKGRALRRDLAQLTGVDEVRGLGLLVGVQIRGDAAQVVDYARQEGLLVVPAGNHTIRFLPPLNIRPTELSEATERFGRALMRAAQG